MLKVKGNGWILKGVTSLPFLVPKVVSSYGGLPFLSPLTTLTGAMTSSRPVMMVNQAKGTTTSRTTHESLPRQQELVKINWQLSLLLVDETRELNPHTPMLAVALISRDGML